MQGFDANRLQQSADWKGSTPTSIVYADRFLGSRRSDEVSVKPGTGYVRTEGSNSKGWKFANFYYFAYPPAITLVLVASRRPAMSGVSA